MVLGHSRSRQANLDLGGRMCGVPLKQNAPEFAKTQGNGDGCKNGNNIRVFYSRGRYSKKSFADSSGACHWSEPALKELLGK